MSNGSGKNGPLVLGPRASWRNVIQGITQGTKLKTYRMGNAKKECRMATG